MVGSIGPSSSLRPYVAVSCHRDRTSPVVGGKKEDELALVESRLRRRILRAGSC